MGIIWKVAMPLLSTLAALVILVHSAEEELDRQSRYDLGPRDLETQPSNYDQVWRVGEPLMRQSDASDIWNIDRQEEPPLRRRLGRKRKRRPPPDTAEEGVAESRYVNSQEDFSPQYDLDDQTSDVTETPRRRRKKLGVRPNRWFDETNTSEVPLRRRLYRKKRPLLDTWPELSEFSGPVKDPELEIGREPIRADNTNEGDRNNDFEYKMIDENNENNDNRNKTYIYRPKLELTTRNEPGEYHQPIVKEDKSLSEFSMEVIRPSDSSNDIHNTHTSDVDDRITDKYSDTLYNIDKAKNPGPVDPQTLKDILKRSNGSSLSEILQQYDLTLADLLSGNQKALAVLKSEKPLISQSSSFNVKPLVQISNINNVTNIINDKLQNNINNPNTANFTADVKSWNVVNDIATSNQSSLNIGNIDHTKLTNSSTYINLENDYQSITTSSDGENSTSGMLIKRRFPGGIRRKLRMRPTLTNNYKSQINRDLIALSARRFMHNNKRNMSKGRQWKEITPLMPNVTLTNDPKNVKESNITTMIPIEQTTLTSETEPEPTTIAEDNILRNVDDTVSPDLDIIETTTIPVEIIETEIYVDITEKPLLTMRPVVNTPVLRRQVTNNRNKKKRKLKTSTTETPLDEFTDNTYNLGNYVSPSEIIEKTRLPIFTNTDEIKQSVTELEDFMVTENIKKENRNTKTAKPFVHNSSYKFQEKITYPYEITTEETAKIEIEEILNDTYTSAKLSKILQERNMTFNELFDHRERGSSKVHLADIFHNASKEPNPPEPFLSKSFIEPISKETYPLRALLEANLHDTTTKPGTIDTNVWPSNHLNIPITMNFGNNVNENADNMGIISLFNNFTNDVEDMEKEVIQKDSDGKIYKSSVIKVNAKDTENDAREDRMLDNDHDDMVSWNEIFTMIRNHNKNESNVLKDLAGDIHKKALEEDLDGDGLVVLEDLQHLKDSDSNMSNGSEENIEFNVFESGDRSQDDKVENIPNSATSVTVATVSIVGLAMVLFLLTYVMLKWKQQRNMVQKSYHEERLPTPVFENRNVKKNCSSRSISPMLPSSNIYTMSTIDSHNGKESPEYMWDTLRKPFQ